MVICMFLPIFNLANIVSGSGIKLATIPADRRRIHSPAVCFYTGTVLPGCGWMILIFGWRARICSSNHARESSLAVAEQNRARRNLADEIQQILRGSRAPSNQNPARRNAASPGRRSG